MAIRPHKAHALPSVCSTPALSLYLERSTGAGSGRIAISRPFSDFVAPLQSCYVAQVSFVGWSSHLAELQDRSEAHSLRSFRSRNAFCTMTAIEGTQPGLRPMASEDEGEHALSAGQASSSRAQALLAEVFRSFETLQRGLDRDVVAVPFEVCCVSTVHRASWWSVSTDSCQPQ